MESQLEWVEIMGYNDTQCTLNLFISRTKYKLTIMHSSKSFTRISKPDPEPEPEP